MNYYEHHIGDYLKDTSHLSLLEHGVYLRLIQVYYTRESPIPDDQAERLIGARAPAEKAALRAVLQEFFELLDGAWSQKRCEQCIAKHREFIGKQKEKAAKRWQSHGNATAMPEHMPRHTHGNANGYAAPQNGDGGPAIPPTSHFPLPNESEVTSSPRRPRKRSRAPEDFQPDLEYARSQLADIDAEREAQKFRDWEFKTPRSDWAAVWRNWISNCRDTGRYARVEVQQWR